ncbi:unnamed protein product [Natator depressus]
MCPLNSHFRGSHLWQITLRIKEEMASPGPLGRPFSNMGLITIIAECLKIINGFYPLRTPVRFEYPPQSTPRKRLSRTPKNETLQVLHVQQVAEVELQSPTSKSPYTSDKIIECEGQNFGENDKQSTEEDISRVVPAKQHATPKSTYRTAKSNRRENEMSPFSKLYELLKNEIDVKTQKDGNEEIPMP